MQIFDFISLLLVVQTKQLTELTAVSTLRTTPYSDYLHIIVFIPHQT